MRSEPTDTSLGKSAAYVLFATRQTILGYQANGSRAYLFNLNTELASERKFAKLVLAPLEQRVAAT